MSSTDQTVADIVLRLSTLNTRPRAGAGRERSERGKGRGAESGKGGRETATTNERE
jgi:hypothetical protein